jgi:ligand-binding sensor domain-containing protein
MTVKRIIILLGLLPVLLMSACGKQEQQSPAKQQPATPATQVAPAVSETSNKGLVGLGYRVVDAFNVGNNVYVRSMTLDKKKNVLWVGTSVGVLEVDVATRNMLHTYTRDQGLANEYVFGMMVDSDGVKWFGTNGGGISRYKDGEWKTYFPMHGLADYWVYSFAQQSNGTIWIGTWAGLNAFDKKSEKFTTYLKELVNEWVYGLDVDAQDNVWVGTEGGVNMFDGKTWKAWTHKDGLGAPNTENLPLSSNTGLGTRSRHKLSVMELGQKTYNPNYVFALVAAPDDTVWAGTWGGGVSHFDGKTWHNFTSKDGLGGNIVYSLARDDNGVLWFGTDGGLTRYDGKHWQTFTKKDGLLDDSIYAIVTTADNNVWVGSRSGVTVLSDK